MITPWMNEVDGMVDAHGFRQAIVMWARGFSMRYRHARGAKPTVAQAQQELRRWSTGYWSRSERIVESELVPSR
jgi:hypothetical protein